MHKVLNHMSSPNMRYDDFMSMAASLECVGVHYRNDLGRPLFDNDSNESVKALASRSGMRITGLAQLDRFNDWNSQRQSQAEELIETAVSIGAEAIGLIPVNDGSGVAECERQANLIHSLKHLKPMLEASGLKELIEPLGFAQCSLRLKSEALAAILEIDGESQFMLVHDTFHHFLAHGVATGAPVFPDHTAVIEISGVVDKSLTPANMLDHHRVLVDEQDVIGNVDQIAEMLSLGFTGVVSFEPFSKEVHQLNDPSRALAESFSYIESRLPPFAE